MRRFARFIPILAVLLSPCFALAQVNLLAMGDWGSGKAEQKTVASAMADYVQKSGQKFHGMLLAGDNFYVTLSGTNDPQWQTLFEDMYDRSILDFPFYVSLGNHDYEQGKSWIERAYAREHPESRWKLPAHYYRVDIPKEKPIVTLLMLDSNRQAMSDADWRAELFWIKTELEKPRDSKWLIACAHHPLFSNGDHGDNGVMQNAWGPLFKRYKLDMYICGHDHDLQHLEVPGYQTSLLLVGGGGKSLRPMRNDIRGPFSKSSLGFAAMKFTDEAVNVRLISGEGEMLHQFVRTPDHQVKVIESLPSDTARPRTVKSITRNDPTTNPATQPFKSDD